MSSTKIFLIQAALKSISSILNLIPTDQVTHAFLDSMPTILFALADIFTRTHGSEKQKLSELTELLEKVSKLDEPRIEQFKKVLEATSKIKHEHGDYFKQLIQDTSNLSKDLEIHDVKNELEHTKIILVIKQSEESLKNKINESTMKNTQTLQKIDEKLEKIFERLEIPDKIEPDEKKRIPASISTKIQMLIKEKNKLESGLKNYDMKIQKQKELSLKLANTFYFQRKYEKAIKMYDDLLKIYPRDFYTLCNKGAALSRIGKHDEAIDYFTKALKIDPTNAYAWRHKAIIHFRLYELKLGLKCMEKARKINPDVNADLRMLFRRTKSGRSHRLWR